jgi:SAM-dependent methyltransferase
VSAITPVDNSARSIREFCEVVNLQEQFAHPTGWLGHVAGLIMARSSRALSEWTLDLLALRPAENVLEVGCGPGVAMYMASERATSGHLAAVDPSPIMIAQARHRNAAAVALGRMELREGSVSLLPFADASFDVAFAVNSSPFWSNVEQGYQELCRVLRPGGRVAIVVQPRWVKTDAQVGAVAAATAEQLRHGGFRGVRMERHAMHPVSAFAVVGERRCEAQLATADGRPVHLEVPRSKPRVLRIE